MSLKSKKPDDFSPDLLPAYFQFIPLLLLLISSTPAGSATDYPAPVPPQAQMPEYHPEPPTFWLPESEENCHNRHRPYHFHLPVPRSSGILYNIVRTPDAPSFKFIFILLLHSLIVLDHFKAKARSIWSALLTAQPFHEISSTRRSHCPK